jgi:hypothetical protein
MARQAFVVLIIVLVFGVFVPWWKGYDFFDPVLIASYACLALLFVAPASADAFAPGNLSGAAALRRLAVILAYGWGVTFLILITGILTVNFLHWRGGLITPRASLSASTLLCSLAACVALGAGCALLSRRFSARTVKSILRIAFLTILLALAFGHRYLPETWSTVVETHMTSRWIVRFAWTGAAIFGVVAAGEVAILSRDA